MMSEQFEVERLVLRLMGLVKRGEALRRQGASEDELQRHRIETERVRWRLANAVRRSGGVLEQGPRAA
jgi:hypothetical protein